MGVLQPVPLGLGPRVLRHQNRRRRHHHAALRKLGNRWLEVLWHCLHLGVRYDEAIHAANRNRALKNAA
jgi:hypothetical protein